MSTIIQNDLRIKNAKNLIDSFNTSTGNALSYVFMGRVQPWADENAPPTPQNNYQTFNTVYDNLFALKRILDTDCYHMIPRVNWVTGTVYDYYRQDYSITNPPKHAQGTSLYSSNFFVLNSDFRVYICLKNGTSPENPDGKPSLDEPTFTDLEPKAAGTSGDGYIWKYLYTIKPSELIKFDSTEFITVPNAWSTTTDTQIRTVRENGNSLTRMPREWSSRETSRAPRRLRLNNRTQRPLR